MKVESKIRSIISWSLTCILFPGLLVYFSGCVKKQNTPSGLDIDQSIEYCKLKLNNTVRNFSWESSIPQVIRKDEKHWTGGSINNWTSGFYPGMLWIMYRYTGDEFWKTNATYYTELLEPVRKLPWKTHDLGFMLFNSYGLGYRFTQNPQYSEILIEAADTLATLYNPRVGTIESWPWMKTKKGWPHTTIIDNMMNLELLFWATNLTGDERFKEIAIYHADKTIKDFIRPDFSTIHVVVYNTDSPDPVQIETDQGYAPNSTWARGQSWAAYGFIKAYQYTRDTKYLETSMNLADYYLRRVPEDLVPYWDFDAPDIPNEPRDVSAAAIMASAMIDIARESKDDDSKRNYFQWACKILSSLSTPAYLSSDTDAFLTGSVTSKPAGLEVGVPIIYADFYFLEALIKAKRFENATGIAKMNSRDFIR